MKRKMQPSGFALVASILLMSLLMIVAIGTVSISSVETRSGQAKNYLAEAEANARLALMIAISQLQENAGPDQRITARADITDPDWQEVEPSDLMLNPHYTYVWDVSGSEHDLSRTSVSLSNDVNFSRPGALPGHDFTRKPVVLVSGNESFDLSGNDGTGVTEYPDGYTTAETPVAGQINIIPAKSFFDAANQRSVSVPLVDVGASGAYGYWIGDESIKSRSNLGNQHENTTVAASLLAQRSPLSPLVEGLDNTAETPADADKTNTVKSLEVAYPGQSPRGWSYSPDFTVTSNSLLTSTRNGGFKQDFTYALYNDEDAVGIPAELKDNVMLVDSLKSTITGNPLEWGWEGARQTRTGGIGPATEYLRDYAKINSSSGQPISIGENGITPVMSQFQSAVHCAYKVDGSKFRVYYSIFPSVTFWNPYNVPILIDKDIRIEMQRRAAHQHGGMNAFKAEYNLSGQPGYRSGNILGNSHPSSGWLYTLRIPQSSMTVIPPGEALIFSPQDITTEDTPMTSRHQQRYHAVIDIEPGYRPGKGHLFALDGVEHDALVINPGSNQLPRIEMSLLGSAYENVTIVSTFRDTAGHVRFFSRWARLGGHQGNTLSSAIEPPKTTDIQQDASGGFPSFLHKYTLRMGEDYLPVASSEVQPSQSTLIFPYVAQFNPRAVHHASFADSAHGDNRRFVPDSVGVSPSLMGSYYDLQTSSTIYSVPTVDTDDLHSYIGAGYNGPSNKMILAELPISFPASYPNSISGGITSLTQLNNSNLASGQTRIFHNHYDLLLSTSNYPAYPIGNSLGDMKLNLTGLSINSSKLATVNSVAKVDNNGWNNRSEAPHYDLSYLLNERFYDHYFFSTIPQTGNYDSTKPLINSRLHPITDDVAELRKISVAKDLILKGGFNINSTSVKAWEMLLSSSMGTDRQGVSSSSDTATFAGTFPSTGSEDISNADVTIATDGSQSLSLNDEEVTLLAEAIVREVKRRGPFPNLSAFVNRTNTLESLLRNDPNDYPADEYQDVRFSGALQSAIDSVALQDQLMNEKPINSANYVDITRIYPGRDAVRKSANSHLPGTLKQSDILRQIDPIITSRGDTFVIRTVGLAKDDTGRIVAKAACEAIVQRSVDYVDSTQDPSAKPVSWNDANEEISELNDTNKKYGRKFELQSFRWLTNPEVNAMDIIR